MTTIVMGVMIAIRQQDYWRYEGVHDKRFRRAQTPAVHDFVAHAKALAVGVEVVPLLSKIEIEDVPTNSLAGFRHDGWRVAHVGSAVDRHLLLASRAGISNRVWLRTRVRPCHRTSRLDGYVIRLEPRRAVLNTDSGARRTCCSDPNAACHRVEVAVVFVGPFGREGKGKHIPGCHRAAVEQCRPARSRHPVKKEWNLVVCLGETGVPDNDPTKQTPVYVFADVHVMVVERPRPNRFGCHVEDVGPRFPWADGVAAAAVMT